MRNWDESGRYFPGKFTFDGKNIDNEDEAYEIKGDVEDLSLEVNMMSLMGECPIDAEFF